MELLEHFAAVSYSAPIFANILLLFSQTGKLPENFRRALWSEHEAALRAITIAPNEVSLTSNQTQARVLRTELI